MVLVDLEMLSLSCIVGKTILVCTEGVDDAFGTLDEWKWIASLFRCSLKSRFSVVHEVLKSILHNLDERDGEPKGLVHLLWREGYVGLNEVVSSSKGTKV